MVYGELPRIIQIPLGLAYIAAVLEQAGHHVNVLDLEVEKVTKDQFPGIIERARPSVAGITCTTPTYPAAVDICEAIKTISPETITVLGGIHSTIMPEQSLKPPQWIMWSSKKAKPRY